MMDGKRTLEESLIHAVCWVLVIPLSLLVIGPLNLGLRRTFCPVCGKRGIEHEFSGEVSDWYGVRKEYVPSFLTAIFSVRLCGVWVDVRRRQPVDMSLKPETRGE